MWNFNVSYAVRNTMVATERHTLWRVKRHWVCFKPVIIFHINNWNIIIGYGIVQFVIFTMAFGRDSYYSQVIIGIESSIKSFWTSPS